MGDGRVYLDTSAYLAVLLAEKASEAVLKTVRRKTLCSSTLLLIESERNLVRLSRMGVLSETDYLVASQRLRADAELFVFRDVTPDLCLTGQYPPVKTPRSSDLVHLRTAHWFREHGGLDAFVTLDGTQAAAALDLALPVVTR